MKRRGAADFASNVMVRVLVQGMRDLGLATPDMGAQSEATVPLDFKRAVLQAAVESGGLACLPLLGRGMHALAMEPTHLALTAGRHAHAMFARWNRLERYIHSRHQTLVTEQSELHACISHVNRHGGPPPLAVEDLVVCGVLCALLEANGLVGVRAQAAECELYPKPQAADLAVLVRAGQTAHWRLTWQGSSTPAAEGASDAAPAQARVWAMVMPPLWSPSVRAIAEHIACALPQAVRLTALAEQLGLPPRSLQRALAAEGLSLTRVMAELRFRLAGWHLVASQMGLAEIGFVCGYADQSHFTRDFSRRVGLTPARYRDYFATA